MKPQKTSEFDPCEILEERGRLIEEPLKKRITLVERSELQAIGDEPTDVAAKKTVPTVLRERLVRERAARIKAKRMRMRERANRLKQRELETRGDEEEDENEPVVEPDQADFILLVIDYPNNADEIRELADEKLGIGGLVDLWAQIYLAGATLGDNGPTGSAKNCTAP